MLVGGLSGSVLPARVPPFERDHHPAEERIELLLLGGGRSLCEQSLLLGLDPHALLVLVAALVGQLDEHASPIAGIAQAADEPFLLERIEAARHGAARELGPPSQLTRRAAI